MLYQSVAIIAFAYILGSVPFGLVIGRVFYRVDIREYGSGNIGATNCYRTLGVAAGVSVLLADLLKGFIPVTIAKFVLESSPELVPIISVMAGLSAIIGHSYSIFMKLAGGKGMSTAAGLIIALWPWATPLLVGLWIIIVALTRYVSLASIITAVALPVAVAVLYPKTEYIIFSVAVCLVIVYRHRSNIARLVAGKELKVGKKVRLEEG